MIKHDINVMSTFIEAIIPIYPTCTCHYFKLRHVHLDHVDVCVKTRSTRYLINYSKSFNFRIIKSPLYRGGDILLYLSSFMLSVCLCECAGGQTRHVHPMPTLNRHWFNVSCLLGAAPLTEKTVQCWMVDGQSRRRWSSVKPALGWRVVFAGHCVVDQLAADTCPPCKHETLTSVVLM